MANKKVFIIRDTKMDSYYESPIFLATTEGEAERMFADTATNQQSFVAKWPQDYDLYLIGELDARKGVVIPLDTPKHIVKAQDLLASLNKSLSGTDSTLTM